LRCGCHGKLHHTACGTAAIGVLVEVIRKLWGLAKLLHLTPEELSNELLLSKNEFVQTTWHIAVNNGHVEVIQKLWDLAKNCS
jgi:5-methylthioribose kinase